MRQGLTVLAFVLSGACTTDGAACRPILAPYAIHWTTEAMDGAACMAPHVDGVSILGADPDAAANGVRLHADFCPGASTPCRCDIVVSDVGMDLARSLAAETNLTVDQRRPDPLDSALVITRASSCACTEPLYLYAAYVDLTNPPPGLPTGYAITRGPTICAGNGSDFGGSWLLHVRGPAGEGDVAGNDTLDLGPLHVRPIEDLHQFNNASYSSGVIRANFVAWTSSPR